MELLLKHGASIQAVTEVREKDTGFFLGFFLHLHLQSLLYAIWSLLILESVELSVAVATIITGGAIVSPTFQEIIIYFKGFILHVYGMKNNDFKTSWLNFQTSKLLVVILLPCPFNCILPNQQNMNIMSPN